MTSTLQLLADGSLILVLVAICISAEQQKLKNIGNQHSQNFVLAHQTPSYVPTKPNATTFNVMSYGALGDGRTDDTQAFLSAWDAACSVPFATVVVPHNGTFLLQPVTFTGPCAFGITFQILGTIVAPAAVASWKGNSTAPFWIVFSELVNFGVTGGGKIDGQGQQWWLRSCKTNLSNACDVAPTAVTLFKCSNVTLGNLTLQNGQQIQLYVFLSSRVLISGLQINTPFSSPNTDGVHVGFSKFVTIQNSNITTGDDCISIQTGTAHMQITNTTCGPSHGISIGGLGKDHTDAQVTDVHVDGVTLSGSTNGLRIKTWQGGQGLASRIHYQNVRMINVANPIIIDQFYCDSSKPCRIQKSAVKVSNVTYINVTGIASTRVAVNFNCSRYIACSNITLQSINITSSMPGNVTSSCQNAQGSAIGDVAPKSCLFNITTY